MNYNTINHYVKIYVKMLVQIKHNYINFKIMKKITESLKHINMRGRNYEGNINRK